MKMMRLVIWLVLVTMLAACGGGETVETAVEPTAASAQAPAAAAGGEEAGSGEETAVLTIGSEADTARTFVVVPAESKASFLVDEEFFADALGKLGIEAGLADVVGSTQEITGELTLNFGNPDLLEAGSFTVQTGSLRTDQSQRDEWLEDNALEKNLFPTATFVATSVAGLPESYQPGSELSFDLLGDLTVRDVTQSVVFQVTAVLDGNTLTGTATLPTRMTDFGIEPPNFANTLTVADEFVIEVELTAQEQ